MPGSPLARTSGGRVALFMRGIPNTNRLTYTPAKFLHFSLDLVGRMCTGVATGRRLSTVISMRCVSIFYPLESGVSVKGGSCLSKFHGAQRSGGIIRFAQVEKRNSLQAMSAIDTA